MDRERKRTRETDQERLSFPLFILVVFLFPPSTAQTISTAECAGRKKTSAVDHDKQSASLAFVSLKNHRAAWVKATAAASSWTSFCIKSWRKEIKLQMCSCWWSRAAVYNGTHFIKGSTPSSVGGGVKLACYEEENSIFISHILFFLWAQRSGRSIFIYILESVQKTIEIPKTLFSFPSKQKQVTAATSLL